MFRIRISRPRAVFRYSRKLWTLVPTAALLLVLFTPAGADSPKKITQPVDDNQTVTLPGNKHGDAKPENDHGNASANLQLERMLLVLTGGPQQDAAITQLIAQQQDKTSANYRKWLTPDQFGSQFGPALEDVQTVISWLQAEGLQVTRTSRARNFIEFSGSVKDIEKAFHTKIKHYVTKDDDAYANDSDPSIPVALKDVVKGIAGLSGFHKKPQSVSRPDTLTVTRQAGSKPDLTLSNGSHALAPADYGVLYQINPVYQSGINGTGTVIGIVGRSNINLNDVLQFRSIFGLPNNPPQIVLNGPNPGNLGGGEEVEALLDVSWAGAVAPNATVKFFVSKSTATQDGVLLSYEYIVDNNAADVMSISFGDCEAHNTVSDALAISGMAQQAAAQGITVLVSSGDSGSAGCDLTSQTTATGPLSVNVLASNPWTIAVGGTQFNENGQNSLYWSTTNSVTLGSAIAPIPENVWNQSCATCNNIVAGGGGASAIFAKPSYQSGVPGIPNDGVRDVPDVSLTSSAARDPYAICIHGSCTPNAQGQISLGLVGGTSAAAPSFAGILGLVRQSQQSRLGQANYVLYALAGQQAFAQCDGSNTSTPPAPACVFNDITVGNNAVPGEPGYGTPSAAYQSTFGFDLATGLGSVNVTRLVQQWNSTNSSSTTVNFSLTPATVNRGELANVAVQVTSGAGVPTGDVSILSSLNESLGGFTLGGGIANGTIALTTPGTYNVFARYAGSGSFAPSDSAAVSVTVTAPVVSPSISVLAFGNQGQGIPSAPKTVTITNTGNGALNINGITFTGANPGDFSQTNDCGASLAVNASCIISVVFQPPVLGARAATMNLSDNALNSPQTFSLTGTGVGVPAVTLSATALDFGSQPIGAQTAAQNITITNTGNASLALNTIVLGGTNPGDFIKTQTCTTSLAVNASCTISVSFKATAAGARSAAVTITDNAPGSPHMVTLTGAGVAVSKIAFSPISLAFGNQTVDSPSAAKVITVSNPGSATLNITSITVSGANAVDYSVSSTTCGATLAPAATCTISVVYKPTATGPGIAAISVSDDAAGSPQSVPLTGTGVLTPKATFTPVSLAFGNLTQGVVSAPKPVTLTNSGNGVLNISSITLAGANAAEFSQTNDCGPTLSPGAFCTISVIFQPATPGTKAATVNVADDASGSPQKVTLSGTGLGIPVASLSVTSIDFGSQPVGSPTAAQLITLSNTGNGALTIGTTTIGGASPLDFTKTTTCTTSLAAGASCTYSIVFKPTAVGVRTATLSITDNSVGSPHTVSFTGSGTGVPKIAFAPASLAYANQTVGTSSAAKAVTVSNPGTATLNITSIGVAGANAADYSITVNTCGPTLAVGATCSLSVVFNPQAAVASSAAVTVADDSAGSPHTVPLSGTGVLTPKATLSATVLGFGSRTQGTVSSPSDVTLTNTGNGILNISSITISGTTPSEFAQTNTCGATLTPGANCTISVVFQPVSPGTKSAVVNVADDAALSPQKIALSGSGLGIPTPSFSVPSLDLGTVAVGSASSVQVVTLTNTGNATLGINTATIAGANPADFTKTATCPSYLAAGASCTFSITFKPTAVGSRTATLTLTDNAPGPPQTVALSGNGLAVSKIAFTPASLAFTNQTVGTTSAARVITVSNPGTATLNISSIGLTGTNNAEYTISGTTCGATLAVGVTCTVSVTFHPSAAVATSASVTVADDAAGSPHSVPMTGSGVLTPKVTFSLASLAFGNQTQGTASTPRSSTVTNTGNGFLNISSVALAGTNAAEFSLTTDCGATLAPGAACTVSAVFQPVSPGTKSATINLTDDASGSPQKVTLSGTGLGIPVASLSAGTLDFGPQTVGVSSAAQVVTLTNTGNGSMTISSTSVTGVNPADFIKTTTCGTSLAAAASCTISITFKPTAAGSRAATLNVMDNAAGSPQQVTLTGTGQ